MHEIEEMIKLIVQAIQSLFSIVTDNGLPSSVIVAGFISILLACGLAYRFVRSNPQDLSWKSQIGFLICLGCGVLLVAAGPAIAMIQASRPPGIAKVALKQSFDNLNTNAHVTHLVRLITYDPSREEDRIKDIRRLPSLGPAMEKYTFVGVYQELRGYKVSQAVRMVGGSVDGNQHVSAIIFRLKDQHDIIPANARGVLQIVNDLQSDRNITLQKTLDISAADAFFDHDLRNIELRTSVSSWSFQEYKDRYQTYCNLTQELRCHDYSVKKYIGGLKDDWNPLGFARSVPPQSKICSAKEENPCDITDWREAERRYGETFGARVFLVKNLSIDELQEPYLIDFDHPAEQVIPDIGESVPSKE